MSLLSDRARMLREVRRRSLWHFIGFAVDILDGRGSYQDNWHIRATAQALEDAAARRSRRLIVTQPPRTLKSVSSSVAYPAWLLGNDPTLKIVCVSYSHDLAKKHAADFRRLVESSEYQLLFPGMCLSSRKNTETEQVTTRGGSRLATSVGGTLTGRGADYIIIDDPLKADDAMSKAERDRVNAWFSGTVVSRLNSQRDGVIVIVMQRLHVDDLVGHLTDVEGHGWKMLNIPAIAERDTDYQISEAETYSRREGALIQPELTTREDLDRLRQEMGSSLFSAQYQQNPLPQEGSLIRRAWIAEYEERPLSFDAIVQSWDTATGGGISNDYAVGTTWGVAGRFYYLLDVWRRQVEYPTLLRETLRLARERRANMVLVEDADIGKALARELRRELRGDAMVRAIRPAGDKICRLEAVSALFEAGRVLIPRNAPWRDNFLSELLSFPGSRRDDQVDSVSQFLNHVNKFPEGVLRFDPVTRRRFGSSFRVTLIERPEEPYYLM